ncbi:hypothetical protein LEP1GSC041_0638 [Leptospira noguchii str. 2006001870]|nr:hypothetical protein LEP1GSC041_0638 [Leptospira noguchii str. 2006001870]
MYLTVKSWFINHFLLVQRTQTVSFAKTNRSEKFRQRTFGEKNLKQITKKEPVGTPAQIL